MYEIHEMCSIKYIYALYAWICSKTTIKENITLQTISMWLSFILIYTLLFFYYYYIIISSQKSKSG